jgi:hypothetical protein
VASCPHCQQELPDPPTSYCPKCGRPTASRPSRSPWEDGRDFFGTVKEVILNPGGFFEAMPVSGGLGSPLLFAFIAGTIGVVAGAIYGLVFNVLNPFQQFLPMGHRGGEAAAFRIFSGGLGFVFQVVLGPIFVVIGIFVGAAIYHAVLWILQSANETFEATFRVVCYAQAVSLLGIIPFCGGLIGGLYAIVVLAIGISKAHRVSLLVGFAVVLIPIFLCCCCLGSTFAAIFGSLGGLSQVLHQHGQL